MLELGARVRSLGCIPTVAEPALAIRPERGAGGAKCGLGTEGIGGGALGIASRGEAFKFLVCIGMCAYVVLSVRPAKSYVGIHSSGPNCRSSQTPVIMDDFWVYDPGEGV